MCVDHFQYLHLEETNGFVSFVDEFTRMTWVTLIKFKHEVFTKFQKFKVKAEKHCGQKMKILRTDGGDEYNSTEF